MLESTGCTIWVNAIDAAPITLVKEVLENRQMNFLELPLLDELLDAESTEPFPYTKSFEEAMKDPFCFLHTSGSTGLPKPIPWSHGLIGTMDAVRLLPPVGENADLVPWTSNWNEGDKIYSTFPMSHVCRLLLFPCFELHYETSCTDRENLADVMQIGRWCYHGYPDACTF